MNRFEILDLIEREEWDGAHRLAQEDSSPEAAYLHGMIHREEGDRSNARYWFAQATELVQQFGFDPMTVDRATEMAAMRQALETK